MKSIVFCDLFQQQLKANPYQKAVIFNQQSITYLELDALSTKLAKNFIKYGVQPGQVIALGFYNDLDLIPALLAIWKARGVYLPIDPNYPTERIRTMFNDALPALLITKTELRNKFSFFNGNKFYIDKNLKHSLDIDLDHVQPDDLSYIIYTSGSTGKPKGILVEHSSLGHAVLAYQELHPDTHIALVSGSISFDPSLLSITYSLSNGGTICLYNNRNGIDIDNADEIIALIKRNAVTFILSTPSFYSKLINESSQLTSLKNVDLCGEDISPELIKQHIFTAPNAYLYNAYGPSEYAIGSTAAMIYDPKHNKINTISIGHSFSSNRAYVLDSKLKKTKPWERGEIFVAGSGLARGYLNLPKLTKQKFFWLKNLENDPIRVYKTGDFGYYLPNSEIVYLGRMDSQIKIHGHLVDLREIESIIHKFQGIKKCIVMSYTSTNKKHHLIAFFSSFSNISKNTLQDFLKELLPSYMIPNQYVNIQKWPLTKNGKIDKKQLLNSIINHL